MKIYYVSGTDIPSATASTVHVMKMCAAFASIGHEVTLLASTTDGAEFDPVGFYGISTPFRIIRFRRSRLPIGGGFHFAWKLAQFVRKEGVPDFFYGRHSYGLLAATWFDRPCGLEVHQLPTSRGVRWSQKLLFKHSQFAGLVSITKSLADDYADNFPEVNFLRSVIAADAADPPKEAVPIEPWPGRSGAFQAGYVGHLYQGKGIEVIAQLGNRLPKIDFHIVGGREQDIENWRSKIGAPNVYFHGFVPNAKLGSFYRHFDVALAPLQHTVRLAGDRNDIAKWTSPLKIFEYMSYGLPILASDIDVLHEVLEDGHNALLLPPNDIDAWVNALKTLEADSGLRKSIGHNGYLEFIEKYTWSKRCEKITSELLGVEN